MSYTMSVKIIGLIVVLISGGCASPATRLSRFAESRQLQESRVSTETFEHVIYRSTGHSSERQLHVYLEGDGLPWILRFIKMQDPTPRRALMLELMSTDTAPAIYIGRPCYNGLYDSAGCDQSMWTSARYSPAVVNSMSAVLIRELRERGFDEVAIFGHSGGGALALLIAEQVPEVKTIVTLAGNLDTDAWIRHHAFSPLYTSLNPAGRESLPASITQVHYLGGQDRNIPPELNAGWINGQKNSFGIAVADYSHSCCWRELWPSILSSLNKGKPYEFPGYIFKYPGGRSKLDSVRE